MSKEKKEIKKATIETMVGVGKKKTIAGREYTILPVNIEDMHLILGNDPDTRLVLLDKKKVEEGTDGASWQLFGLNILDEKRKQTFLYILNKYVYYSVGGENIPMTEDMLIEHGWSFKEIGTFLYIWTQEVSD